MYVRINKEGEFVCEICKMTNKTNCIIEALENLNKEFNELTKVIIQLKDIMEEINKDKILV